MKSLLSPLALVLLAFPNAHAQDFLQGLYDSQTESRSSVGSGGSEGTPVVTPNPSVNPVVSVSSSQNCPSTEQKTIPLKYVLGMLRTKGASLQLSHDLDSGRLNIRGGEFLSNCNGMLEWGMRRPSTDAPQYVVELKIKSCGSDPCTYKVMEKNADGLSVEKEISVKPDFTGFQQCLKDTGVLGANGAVNINKMVIRDLDVNLSGLNVSAPVWFGSNLPMASAAYKKQQEVGCYYMEDIRQGGYAVYTSEDAERMRLDEQAQKLCQTDNYQQINDFLERYGQYTKLLGSIRDELIKKTYKDLAEKVRKGENLETLDYSIISDFQKFVVDPLTTRITALYEEIGGMPMGQDRRVKEQQLQALMRELASYKSSPYITAADMDKLMAKGLFDEAASVNGIHLTAQHYGRLGATESGVRVTPRVARQRIQEDRQKFQRNLAARRDQYDVQTGRVTGKSEYYAGLAAQHRRNIEIRTANYTAEINDEIARITQPNGYCFRYFRNTQRCVQDSMQRIQDLRTQLSQYNSADAKIASDLEQKANQYRGWEQQGQRYIANQNGEEAEESNDDDKPEDVPQGPSVQAPSADRTADQQQQPMYQFQMPTQQQGVMPGQQYNPYMQGQQYSGQFQQNMMGAPWGQYQQNQNPYMYMQQPYMGYGLQNGGQGYTFNQNAMMGMQQPFMGYGMQSYGGNMWAGQFNPYQMGGGFGFQGGFGGGMGGMGMPGMYQSPFSNGMGQGLTYYR